MKRSIRSVSLALLTGALAVPAYAHSFGNTFVLPLPVWVYMTAAGVSLAASFLVIGLFVKSPGASRIGQYAEFDVSALAEIGRKVHLRALSRGLSVFLLCLCIATGLFGKNQAYQNFNMTFFWVIFFLGLTYLTALVGDIYKIVNPWKVLAQGIARRFPAFGYGLFKWPEQWGCYPAFWLYAGFIWVELFGRTDPRSLALYLVFYTVLNMTGCLLLGIRSWFQRAEFFAVYFKILGMISPFGFRRAPQGRLFLRISQPFYGLLDSAAFHKSEVLFILFMLSSTAFDGFKDTVLWIGLYWKYLHGFTIDFFSLDLIHTYRPFQIGYAIFQSAAIPLSAYFYLLVYLFFLAATKYLARSHLATGRLALTYVRTLVPIALVYNAAHYFVLFLLQGPQVIGLLSDPFGFGWNLFGTKGFTYSPLTSGLLTMDLVWSFQVWVIILGHIVSVYLAHLQALQGFDRRNAVLSQVPILLLMVVLTTLGLWIMSLPLSA